MARAIFGTSPKNEKKCKFSDFTKVTFGNWPFVFLDGIAPPDESCQAPEPFSLETTGSLCYVDLKMEFFFFLAEKLKNFGQEKHVDDGTKHFEILIWIGS